MANAPFQVQLRSYHIIGVGNLVAVHHEIIFLKDDKVILALNGNPRNRETGEVQQGEAHGLSTLRVDAIVGGSFKDGANQQVGSAVLFAGNEADMKTLMGKALEAATLINAQNIDYLLIQNAQNSNSVARSLIDAMDLSVPEMQRGMIAPGFERTLIPSEWRAQSDSLGDRDRDNYVSNALMRIGLNMKIERGKPIDPIAKQVRAEPNRYAHVDAADLRGTHQQVGVVFDPAKAVPGPALNLTPSETPVRLGPIFIALPTLEEFFEKSKIRESEIPTYLIHATREDFSKADILERDAKAVAIVKELLASNPAKLADMLQRLIDDVGNKNVPEEHKLDGTSEWEFRVYIEILRKKQSRWSLPAYQRPPHPCRLSFVLRWRSLEPRPQISRAFPLRRARHTRRN